MQNNDQRQKFAVEDSNRFAELSDDEQDENVQNSYDIIANVIEQTC